MWSEEKFVCWILAQDIKGNDVLDLDKQQQTTSAFIVWKARQLTLQIDV